jgi:hypothetical protein
MDMYLVTLNHSHRADLHDALAAVVPAPRRYILPLSVPTALNFDRDVYRAETLSPVVDIPTTWTKTDVRAHTHP